VVNTTPSPGARIKEARNALGVSQKAFAARLGTTRRRVIAWEGGENVPGPRYLQRIAAATGRNIEFFLDGTTVEDEEDTSLSSLPHHEMVAVLMPSEALRRLVREELAEAATR
jgi:transcriptional regulator with XRE-family HTH domain